MFLATEILNTSEDKKGKGIFYLLEPLSDDSAKVRKFQGIEDSKKEIAVYEISDGTCSCKGFHFQKDCKHIDLMRGTPRSNPISLSEAQEVARELIRALKKSDKDTIEVFGDLASRTDPVRLLHFLVKSDQGTNAYRMILWLSGGVAVIIDKVNGGNK